LEGFSAPFPRQRGDARTGYILKLKKMFLYTKLQISHKQEAFPKPAGFGERLTAPIISENRDL
jgi:hypothetical protein